ncbi:TIGR01621 family pseudouridine synthase [Paraglaciecola sp. 2405UD69-4]|uniref:TIGR01621 family pseudouridine synthase n=1 Tax=Paraglaciecola sp. 2405UD69-4 TaxID=3391836 RepID=UPI0039C97518
MNPTIRVLFDHSDFIIVDKPSQIAVQNEDRQQGILPVICQQLDIEKLWLVHRLDKITSGILILAKTAEAAASFGHIFEQRKIEKYYLALSTKKPKKKQGSIKGGMKKVRDGKWILNGTHTQQALTQFFSFSVAPNLRLYLVKPLTGKTHQIRVALKSLGAPILGDELYGGQASDRTYLHAFAIKFTYKDMPIALMCPPSEGEYFTGLDTQAVISNQQQPWSLNWPKYTINSLP